MQSLKWSNTSLYIRAYIGIKVNIKFIYTHTCMHVLYYNTNTNYAYIFFYLN